MDDSPVKRTLLCVQTDAEALEWLRHALPMYECVFARTAYEAVRGVHTSSVDAYVLDYWLPDWAGPSLCREIRKDDPHSPVLFLAQGTDESAQKRAMRAGASAYLRKPVDGEVLRETLQSLFDEADLSSLRAKSEAEQAVRDVLQRSAAQAAVVGKVRDVERSIERIARTRAYKAFIACGGTRAHFHNWWPQVFENTRAGHAPIA